MKFSVLSSGSKGNATLIEAGDIRLLIDVGISCRTLESLLKGHDVAPESIHAALITHEHTDHTKGLSRFAGKYAIEVYANEGTATVIERQCQKEECKIPIFTLFESNIPFALGGLTITPVRISHDTAEPVGYLIDDGETTLGYFTDLGVATPSVTTAMKCCQALILESNHDPQMLQHSSYPYPLIMRISGSSGHLSNLQACEAIITAQPPQLKHLVLAHLSEECNSPDVAHTMMSRTLQLIERSDVNLYVATQKQPLPFIEC